MRKFLSRCRHATWYVLRKAFLPLAVVAAVVGIAIPVFDLRDTVVVEGRSMQPEIPIYSYIIVQEAGDLKVGDVITYKSPHMDQEATHRIIEVKPDGTYKTKGDDSAADDAFPVRREHIIGKPFLTIPGIVAVFRVAFWKFVFQQDMCMGGVMMLLAAWLLKRFFLPPLPRGRHHIKPE